MAWGWPPSSRQAWSNSCSPSDPRAGSDFASSKAPYRDSGPTWWKVSGGPLLRGGRNGWRQVMSSLPRCDLQPQLAINSARARSRIVQPPETGDMLSSKLSRTTGPAPGRGPVRAAGPAGEPHGRSARSAARTDRACALPARPPVMAKSGGHPAQHRVDRNLGRGMTAMTRSGSRWLTRETICVASADLPIPAAPCSTSPASAGPVRSAAQRRRWRSGSGATPAGHDPGRPSCWPCTSGRSAWPPALAIEAPPGPGQAAPPSRPARLWTVCCPSHMQSHPGACALASPSEIPLPRQASATIPCYIAR